MIYIDNNAVRDALIAGHTANTLVRKILIATLGLESELQLTRGMHGSQQTLIWPMGHLV